MCCKGLILGFVVVFFSSTVFAQSGFTIVARTGQSASGTNATYDMLSAPAISASGQVAFMASLAGTGITAANDSAIFAGAANAPSLLVRNGAPVPSAGAGFTLDMIGMGIPRFNADGHALFGSTLTGPGIDQSNQYLTSAYWLASPGNLQKIAPAIGFGGSYDTPLLTAGDLAVWPANDGLHIWTPANSNPPATNSEFLGLPVVNASGAVAYLGHADAAGATVAIFLGTPGNMQKIAVSGDAAPGLPAGTQFVGDLYPSINAAGQAAFHAYLSGGMGDSVWIGGKGNLALIARTDTPAPGTGGLRYGSFNLDIDDYRTPAISGAGEVAFACSLINDQGTQGSGLFAGKAGQVRLVAQEGEHAGNAPQFVTVGELSNATPFCINSAGLVAFNVSSGLYAADASGALMLVAGIGLPFELAPGDIRTIAEIGFGEAQTGTGGEDGRAFAFNDAGQLAFELTFTDNGSAVVVTAVPEPGGVGLVALVMCVIGCQRSRIARRF
jgi:hypothetical protein